MSLANKWMRKNIPSCCNSALINKQDGIIEYGGKFLIFNNQGGWNKQANGRNMKEGISQPIKNKIFTLIMYHLDKNCKKN